MSKTPNRHSSTLSAKSTASQTKPASSFSKLYDIQNKLGEGGYSTVWKCIKKDTKETFAVKIINTTNMNKKQKKRVKLEIQIHSGLKRHANIIGIYDYTQEANMYRIIIEFAAGGELFAAIIKAGRFSETESARFMTHILSGLSYIHSQKIIHRDIKPENLLLSHTNINEAVIKISDFGLAVQTKNDQPRHYGYAGTPSYMPPEMLAGEPYNKSTDVWSSGVVLYILLCGYPPFYSDDSKAFKENIKRGTFDFPSPDWDSVSANAKALIKAMLMKDANQRMTTDDALKHIWIVNRGEQEKATEGSPVSGTAKSFLNLKNAAGAQNMSVLHTVSGNGGSSIESVKSNQ